MRRVLGFPRGGEKTPSFSQEKRERKESDFEGGLERNFIISANKILPSEDSGMRTPWSDRTVQMASRTESNVGAAWMEPWLSEHSFADSTLHCMHFGHHTTAQQKEKAMISQAALESHDRASVRAQKTDQRKPLSLIAETCVLYYCLPLI